MKNRFFLPQLLTIAKKLVYILPLFFIQTFSAVADEGIRLEPIVVTATRIYTAKGEKRFALRSEDFIELDERGDISNFSLPSLLDKRSVTDIRTRGPYGVQADLSMRGAPFEENLVLLDGVSINDPKSGHHNMDLPLTMFDTERVDLTYGPASSVYGSGALGGAVNIIPKKPEDKLSFFVSSSAGSWDFFSGGASLNIPLGPVKNRTSMEWKRNTGYAPDTEFDMLTVSSRSIATFECVDLDVFGGYLTKRFGADSFYSDAYPNEEESVNTGLLIAKARVKKDPVSIAPLFYLKRLQDKFILDRNRPSFSRNDHTTYLYGGEITAEVRTPLGEIAFGTAMGAEEISSTNLGDHFRSKGGTFFEYEHKIFDFFLNASARLDYYSTFGPEFCPSLNLGYEFFPHLTGRIGAARAFRAPTFTDLYYSSPANRGNPDLKPETAWVYDAGLNYNLRGAVMSGTIFLRNTKNMIDWTRTGSEKLWQAENIGEFDIYGLESSIGLDVEKFTDVNFFKNITLKYSYLQGLDKKGITSKYVLEYLKHNLNLNVMCELPFGFIEEFDFSFRKRMGHDEYFLLDTVIYRDIELKAGKMTIYVRADNIFNTAYTEQGDIEMPGFAVYGGASVRF